MIVILGTTTPMAVLKLPHAYAQRQHSTLLNSCFRPGLCRQSDVGQNTQGNDNQVTGFADQSDNIQQSTTVNRTIPTPSQTPIPTPTPTPPLQPSFSNPVPLDNSPGDQTDPHIASAGRQHICSVD